MSFFGLKKAGERFGVVIDIGSGSVLTAIVHSDPSMNHPQILWSHREHAPLRNINSLEQSSKAVMTALVNASMQLDSVGRKVLHDYDNAAKLTELQCSISAPWSYTVTKAINYDQEKPFRITEELIEELTRTVQEKISSDLRENEAMNDLGLEIITRSTMSLLSNGYRVNNPEGEETKSLTISHASVVAQQYLTDAINEMQEKLFTETECRKTSFILMLYVVAKRLLPQTYDVCLVDVTYEATEIGVVRDGILKYSTHTPFGSFSLAREISSITNVPLHEAFGYLHTEKPYEFMESLSDAKKEDVEKVFDAYIDRIEELFHETGDSLSIPKRIALHSDLESESLFLNLLEKAAKRVLKADAYITPLSKEIIKQTYTASTESAGDKIPNDTALLLSAQFFHMIEERGTFEYF